MRVFVILFFIICFSLNVASQDRWIFIGNARNKNYYFDKTTLVLKKNKNIIVWTKIINPDNYTNLARYEINCLRKNQLILQVLTYDPSNQLVSTDNTKDVWITPVPESIGEYQINKACSYHNQKIRKPNKKKKY